VLGHLERSGRSGGRRDVLLDGPRQRQQLEHLLQIIRDAGRPGIPVLGYDFSLAGVAGRVKGRFARADVQGSLHDAAFASRTKTGCPPELILSNAGGLWGFESC
jgi:hypothetical protein